MTYTTVGAWAAVICSAGHLSAAEYDARYIAAVICAILSQVKRNNSLVLFMKQNSRKNEIISRLRFYMPKQYLFTVQTRAI